jgi:DNA-binding IclR family transcriptional regulator
MEPKTDRNAPQMPCYRTNLIKFASLLFNRMSSKYGGTTTLNELVVLNDAFVCQANGKPIRVVDTAQYLDMPKSTVSRILTGMRAKGFVTEQVDSGDRRRRNFKLTEAYLNRGDDDMQQLLDWCAEPENAMYAHS